MVLQHAFDSFSSHPLACAQPRYSRTLAELNVIIVESLIGLSYPFVEFFGSTFGRAHVKLLTEGLPGIHQRFSPKKRFCVFKREYKTGVFCLEMMPQKHLFQNYISTITAVKT